MDFQVSIVGGGVAGALLALSLGKSGIRTCLIDRGKPSVKLTNPLIGRTTSLNLFSIQALKEVGIWEDIYPQARVFDEIFVWDAEGSSSVQFNAFEIEKKELGVIVHNNIILQAIFNSLQNIPEVTLMEEESLAKIFEGQNTIDLTTESGKRISSEILIGADGSLSRVRDFSKIPIRKWSYDQLAIVSSVKTTKSIGSTAFQIFTDTGPIAFLPLVEGTNHASLIWSTDKSYGEKLLKLDKEALSKELRLKTEERFGEIDFCEDINSFPLHQLHAKKFYKERTILVGDSAHTIHPLAGQGLNLGIADVRELSHLLASLNRYGKSMFDKEVIQTYSKKREPESYKMIALMEAFKRGFGSESLLIRFGRNFAFDFANRATPIKRRLIKEAAGII